MIYTEQNDKDQKKKKRESNKEVKKNERKARKEEKKVKKHFKKVAKKTKKYTKEVKIHWGKELKRREKMEDKQKRTLEKGSYMNCFVFYFFHAFHS